MIAHRVQTHFVPEPPVRVYRIIALTFLFITIILLGIVIFTMLKKTEITIIAKEDTKSLNIVVSAELQKKGDKSLASVVTTTNFFWSEKYAPTATREVDGMAKGKVVIYNKLNESQTLVKTTRLLTPEGKLFRLSDRVTIPANGETTADVYADEKGASFDIGPAQFTIPGLSAERQKFVYAESKQPMAGGSGKIGVVSESDFKSAENDYAEKAKQAFLNSFSANYPGLDSKIVSINTTGTTSTHPVGAEASEFSISGSSIITVVLYNSNDLNEILKKEVNSQIDTASEKILSIGDSPKISIASADAAANTAQLQIITEATVTLDANAPLLNKENFLNKQKGEIDRYIFALPHVTGMSVKFTPSWITRAPAVADKIRIVVKNEK